MKTDKYYFFWGGFLSQWFDSNFREGGIKFNCAEQYMMYRKAILFNDRDSADKILRLEYPGDQKKVGREVKNFDPVVWDENKFDIVVQSNINKFEQNPDLLEMLMDTKDLILVEASPYDNIWGIGIPISDPIENLTDETKWKGENLLGKALMKVREELKK